MAPKYDSSKMLIPKKNTQKKPAQKSTLQLRNKDTNVSYGAVNEYPVKGQVEPRENKPW